MLEPEITPPRPDGLHYLIQLGLAAASKAEANGAAQGGVNPANVRRAASDAAENARDVFVRAMLAHLSTEAAITDELIRRDGGGAA